MSAFGLHVLFGRQVARGTRLGVAAACGLGGAAALEAAGPTMFHRLTGHGATQRFLSVPIIDRTATQPVSLPWSDRIGRAKPMLLVDIVVRPRPDATNAAQPDDGTQLAEAAPGDRTVPPLSTAPDRTGDEPTGAVAGYTTDVGGDGTGADGEASDGDLLSLTTLSRGGIALSGGYSSFEGPVVSVKLARTNIGGPGHDITLSARHSKIQTLTELGIADSNFLGSKVTVAPTLFYSRASAKGFDDSIRAASFRQRARGGNVYVARPMGDGLRLSGNYRYSDESFRLRRQGEPCDATRHGSLFCNALGDWTNSVFTLSVSLDRRDSSVDPTRGFQVRLIQDYAGPGGTTRYLRLRGGGTAHRRIGNALDISLGLEGGVLKELEGRSVPLFDRFYVGGNSMRGFDLRGMGPKLLPTAALPGQATAIGGKAYYVARLEVATRIDGALDKFGVTPSLFVDAGSVFGASTDGLLPGEALIGNSAKPRVTVGMGLSFNVSAGKLRLNLAHPVVRQKGDRAQAFSISFGTAF